MIIRYEGGNRGITAYLENGRKKGRDLHRDTLDNRVVIAGDLRLTEAVINSIEDKNQDRYLRIVMSFIEDDISDEKIKNITDDYREKLMSAYDENEYCFYAEIHKPKVKHEIDKETGELKERKTHVHIVIPKVNLITNKTLNPVGLVKSNIKHLDAIQEHLNIKHDSISPKDRQRTNENKFNSFENRDIFKSERKQEFKSKLLNEIHEKNIKTIEDFKNELKKYGSIRVYNEGKPEEYLGVKLEGG